MNDLTEYYWLANECEHLQIFLELKIATTVFFDQAINAPDFSFANGQSIKNAVGTREITEITLCYTVVSIY